MTSTRRAGRPRAWWRGGGRLRQGARHRGARPLHGVQVGGGAAQPAMNSGTLVDRNLEAGRGAKVAVRCAGAELTYAQLHDRVCRAGNALRELGVGREDRVLMILDDTFAFPTVFLGAMRMGAVPVPVSFLDTLDNFR